MSQIEVSIKVRPLIGKEESRLWVIPDENQLVQIDPRTQNHRGETFYFDHVFSEKCNNTEVFDVISKGIVEAAVNGFNGTIFAYGQTSSGKTHTMRGSPSDPGLIQLAVEYLFQLMGQKLDREFLLRVSYIEIYNETINDLLKRDNVNLKLKEENGQVIIPSATEVPAVTIPSIFALLEKGEQNRRIAETCMNDRSSRSHAIFRLLIESKGIDDAVQVSQLNLVDLAGSEKTGQSGMTGSTFKEGCHINKSLTVLGKVINDLSENPDGFINYRDSKLTRILQSALGGNALTAIVCTVAPASADHTTSTLGFAQRAKKIKNKPKVNEVLSKDAHIKRLHLQMAELQAELEAFKGHRTTENETYNAEKLENLKKLQDMLINGTIANDQNTSEMKQRAKRRQTWCNTKSFKQARKSVDTFGAVHQWTLQSIQEQDSINSGSTEDNADCLSQFNEDNFEGEFASPVNFGTQNPVSDFVTTRRGTASRILSVHAETPPTLLRERAQTYLQEMKSLQELTEFEKDINQQSLLEKLELAQAENTKLKLELTNLERSKFEVEYEQGKKLEKAQLRVNELQSSLENAWSSQTEIESRSLLLETENKELLVKIDQINEMKQSISDKTIETPEDGQRKLSAVSDELDCHKRTLLKEIVALNPIFEIADKGDADAEQLLTLLLSTVTEKQSEFFTNLSEMHDSKVKVLGDEVNSLKQTIATLEQSNAKLPESRETNTSELSSNFESQLALYEKQLQEKVETITELNVKLTQAEELTSQLSQQIEILQRDGGQVDKDRQFMEMQAKLCAADEEVLIKSQKIHELEENITISKNQLEQNKMILEELQNKCSTTAKDGNSVQVDSKLSLNDEILEQNSQQIAELITKLAQVEEENLQKQLKINKFETEELQINDKLAEKDIMINNFVSDHRTGVELAEAKFIEMENVLQEKMLIISELEGKLSAFDKENSQIGDHEAKFTEMENVLQEKMLIISELEGKLSALGKENSQIGDHEAKFIEMENVLQEKMLIISELEEKLSALGKENSQIGDHEAKLTEMENVLQEKMLIISELEGKLSAFDKETSQFEDHQVKFSEMENVLQEKMLIISELEDKLSALDKENSQIGDHEAKFTEMENVLQEKMLIISELEEKLSALGKENSQIGDHQSKFNEMENVLQEKMLIISELEGKLSALGKENSQIGDHEAKFTEMENVLQEKMLIISELEGKLSAFDKENSQIEDHEAKFIEMENVLQEKMLIISELEGKLSALGKENSQIGDHEAKFIEMENVLQEKMLIISELEGKLSAFDKENSQIGDHEAKFTEMENVLQEKMLIISELEGKLSVLDKENLQIEDHEAKFTEMENVLQEKMLIISELEGKLSVLDKENLQIEDHEAKFTEIKNVLQEKMLTISELEEKLSALGKENSQIGDYQAKFTEVENVLQEKMLTISELEGKLSAYTNADSQETQIDGLSTNLVEVEDLLQGKKQTVLELESKLALLSNEPSPDPSIDELKLNNMQLEESLQEKLHIIAELESKVTTMGTEDAQNAQTNSFQVKLLEMENLLQEKTLAVVELEDKLSVFNSECSQESQVDIFKAKLEDLESQLRERMLTISELESKLSNVGQYGNIGLGKSSKVDDSFEELENGSEEKSSSFPQSPTILESDKKFSELQPELGSLYETCTVNVPESVSTPELSAADVSELQANVTLAEGLLKTAESETQTDVCDLSNYDKNIIQVLENQLEKTRQELMLKLDDIQSMQASLTDKCVIIETLNEKYSKIDSEFKSLAENYEAVASKLHDAESKLNAKIESIALLETELQEKCIAYNELNETLSSSNADFIKKDENIKMLEDLIIKVRASLKTSLDENSHLQKTLYEKALVVEDLEGKCNEQAVRYREQSERFNLLEIKLQKVETDLKSSLNEIILLHDDLKERDLFVDTLQSHETEMKTRLDSLDTQRKCAEDELQKSKEVIRSLEDERKGQMMEIQSTIEKLNKLEQVEIDMKVSHESNLLTILSQQKSLEENAVIIQKLKEQSNCFENDLAIKLNEITTLKGLLEEKSDCYEKDLENRLEKINEITGQIGLLTTLLEEKEKVVRDFEDTLSKLPNQEDVEKQSTLIRELQKQLAVQEQALKENAEANQTLNKQLEEARKENKDLDKENDFVECLLKEAEARESALETDMETLKAELELARTSLSAMEENAEANQTLNKQLEEARKENKDLDKENDYVECLLKEAEARESALETDMETLKAELELARTSLDAAKEDAQQLKTTISKYQTLQKDLTDQEKKLLALHQENESLKENLERTMSEKQGLNKELECLKRTPCECKNLKARVKALSREIEQTNLELVHRNGEYAKLELQIIKEEFPQKAMADAFRKENDDLKAKIKILKTELQRIQAEGPNGTSIMCPNCLGKPREAAKSVQAELPLKGVPAEAAKLSEKKMEETQRQCTVLQEKNQQYKKIAHDRMIYIVHLEREMGSLVPGFKPRVNLGNNKENK